MKKKKKKKVKEKKQIFFTLNKKKKIKITHKNIKKIYIIQSIKHTRETTNKQESKLGRKLLGINK